MLSDDEIDDVLEDLARVDIPAKWTTHWEGCHKRHLACAIHLLADQAKEANRLQAARNELIPQDTNTMPLSDQVAGLELDLRAAEYVHPPMAPQMPDLVYRHLLRYPDGLTVPEIAAGMGCRETQVRSALSRAAQVYGILQLGKRRPVGCSRAMTVYVAEHVDQPKDYAETHATRWPWWRRVWRRLRG